MKSQQPSMRFIRESLANNSYRLTRHATMARLNRGIKMIQLKQALSDGEIIERYPDDEPYPSCLVIGWLETGDPLHIVVPEAKPFPNCVSSLYMNRMMNDGKQITKSERYENERAS